jgi:hypothetical protein
LSDLRNIFNNTRFHALAQKSDSPFEWARLTSEHVKGTNQMGSTPMRLDAEVAGTSASGTCLLNDMHGRIMPEIMPEDDNKESTAMFLSVMQVFYIIGTALR